MGRPREHDNATREALRAAAERLFDRGGVAAVSARAVAEAVGTTTRAVYSLFGSMDGLLVDAMAQRAYDLLDQGLTAQVETDDPAADLSRAAIDVFRQLICAHPALFRITFQRVLPRFTAGPELIAARARALARLRAKVARLDAAGQLGDTPVDEALLAFQSLCEGLANIELRGDTLRLLPRGSERETWSSAFDRLIRGFAACRTPPSRASASRPGRQPHASSPRPTATRRRR